MRLGLLFFQIEHALHMAYVGEMKVYFWEQGWMFGYYDEVCERVHLSKHEVFVS